MKHADALIERIFSLKDAHLQELGKLLIGEKLKNASIAISGLKWRPARLYLPPSPLLNGEGYVSRELFKKSSRYRRAYRLAGNAAGCNAEGGHTELLQSQI